MVSTPPFRFPLNSLPFTHIFFPFSLHVLLPSCSIIALRSFFCAHNGPALNMYVHSLPSTQVSGRPGFDNEVWFMVVPVHLVSPSSQLIVLSPHVFILMSSLRAHMHICSPTSFWAPHLGGACVCVCVCVSTPVLKDFTPIFMTALVGLSFGTTLSDFPSMQQGDAGDFHGRHPTKTPWISCDMSQGRLTHVPAFSHGMARG